MADAEHSITTISMYLSGVQSTFSKMGMETHDNAVRKDLMVVSVLVLQEKTMGLYPIRRMHLSRNHF